MATYNYRCSIRRRCGARVTLPKMIEFYVRQPRCPGCGQHTLKIEPWTGRATQKRTCHCKGVHYPHVRGTFLSKDEFCEHALVDLDFEGSQITEMKPDDDVPF